MERGKEYIQMKKKLQILSIGLLTSVIGLAAKLPSKSYNSPEPPPGDPGNASIGDGFIVLTVVILAYVGYQLYSVIKHNKIKH